MKSLCNSLTVLEDPFNCIFCKRILYLFQFIIWSIYIDREQPNKEVTKQSIDLQTIDKSACGNSVLSLLRKSRENFNCCNSSSIINATATPRTKLSISAMTAIEQAIAEASGQLHFEIKGSKFCIAMPVFKFCLQQYSHLHE